MTDQNIAATSQEYGARKFQTLAALVAYAFAISVFPEADESTDLLLSIPIMIMAIRWCYLDAAERGISIGRPLSFLLVLLLIAGLPVYLFQSRGWRGGLKSLFFTALFILIVATASICGELTGNWIRAVNS